MRGFALALLVALGAAGCGSDDDDDGGDDGGSMTDGGDAGDGGGTTGGNSGGDGGGDGGDLAGILGRGPADEPVDFDAAALSADLEALFGGTSDEPVDITEGDDVEDLADRRRRAGP